MEGCDFKALSFLKYRIGVIVIPSDSSFEIIFKTDLTSQNRKRNMGEIGRCCGQENYGFQVCHTTMIT